MTKTEAANLFGGTLAALGRAVNLGRSRISQWPDELEPVQVDRVLGACVRLGVPLPAAYAPKPTTKAAKRERLPAP